ncbi:unnamed protein product [Caenorhabditis sp. 36 PRJEB53466]|nr:unnamed protein product [Caenorhabditis sp. 36 PRJEB53466]
MSVNIPPVPVAEPEKVIAFFVPIAVSAYATELLELALRDTPGVTVCAGTVVDYPKDAGIHLSALRPDAQILPDMDFPVVNEEIRQDASKKRNVKKIRYRHFRSKQLIYNRRKLKKKKKCKDSPPEAANHRCAHELCDQLAKKYGAPIPNPDGSASAPILMIQYPDLPFMVPYHQEFNDIGVPREVVDFCYTAVFTADPNERLPNLKLEGSE